MYVSRCTQVVTSFLTQALCNAFKRTSRVLRPSGYGGSLRPKRPQVRISQGAPYFSDTYTDFPNLQPVNRTVTVVKIVGTHCPRSVPSSAVFVALYASKRENAFSANASMGCA